MTDTETLIAQLSREANTPTQPRSPLYWGLRVFAVLFLYGIGAQWCVGVRPDVTLQMMRPFFASEIMLLVCLFCSSTLASILTMYPDAYQKPALLTLPYAVFACVVAVVMAQFWMPHDVRMAMPSPSSHTMECSLYIAMAAIIPASLMFALLRKGASIRPFQAGSFAVLASSAIGCLTLRLGEADDVLLHVISWHYLPTLLFAILGAALGARILKW